MTDEQLDQFAREDRMTSVDSPFSLHDVGQRGVSVHWDEAVAIVEELCEVAIAAVCETVLQSSEALGRVMPSRQEMA